MRILEPGHVFVDYGPVSMVVTAFKNDMPMTEDILDIFDVIDDTLKEMSASLEILRQMPDKINPDELGSIASKMYKAVTSVGEPTLTPMAAVAGTMADITAGALELRGATRVITNNGGDIALRLKAWEEVRIGLMSDLSSGKIDHILTVSGEDGIGGLATSGLGGRSLTRGIANAVTVLSSTCRQADALATHIANCSYIKSDSVVRTKASNIDPTSDIADLDITISVGKLSQEEIERSLSQVKEESIKHHDKGILSSMIACVQGKYVIYPEEFRKKIIKKEN